jgi:hypothetical protein
MMKYNFEIYYKVSPNKKFGMNDYLKFINDDVEIVNKDKVVFDLAKKYNTSVNSHDFDTEIDMENFDIAKFANIAQNLKNPEDIFKSNLSTIIIGRNMNVELDEVNVINFINDIPEGYTFITVSKKVNKNDNITLYSKFDKPEIKKFSKLDLDIYRMILNIVKNN